LLLLDGAGVGRDGVVVATGIGASGSALLVGRRAGGVGVAMGPAVGPAVGDTTETTARTSSRGLGLTPRSGVAVKLM
jgi:hypothetical protein